MSPNFPQPGGDNFDWDGPNIKEYTEDEVFWKCLTWFCWGMGLGAIISHLIGWWLL